MPISPWWRLGLWFGRFVLLFSAPSFFMSGLCLNGPQFLELKIHNDEYAVINRNILQHQHHPPTTTVINRDVVYITPTPEYDRLNHSDKNNVE
jgi:hypothetical protein